MKAYKVTISGSYRAADYKYIDYSGVTGFIPYTQEDIAEMHIRGRYARMWIMQDGKFKDRLLDVRECYIDAMVECEHEFSFVGKDIREMTQEELQDLATAKDLRLIPLYKKGSEREARTKAYAAYSEQVLKNIVKYQEEGFNLMKQPPIIVTDSAWRKDTTRKLTNDEVMDAEANIGKAKSPFSREELESLAKANNIKFHPGISDDKLYERIYGGKAA